MRRLLPVLTVFVLFVAFRSPSFADGSLERVVYVATVSDVEFTDLAINTTKTTDAIRTLGFNEVTVWINYTYSSATYVNMTCEEQMIGDTTTWYKIPMCNDSSPPDSTCEQLRKRWPVIANDAWRWRIPIMGRRFRCSFITTGGGSSDVASVRFMAGRQ
jgi:hypothetical protein